MVSCFCNSQGYHWVLRNLVCMPGTSMCALVNNWIKTPSHLFHMATLVPLKKGWKIKILHISLNADLITLQIFSLIPYIPFNIISCVCVCVYFYWQQSLSYKCSSNIYHKSHIDAIACVHISIFSLNKSDHCFKDKKIRFIYWLS